MRLLWNPWESKAPGRRDKQMGSYIPATEEQKQKMLEAMGLSSTDELFSHFTLNCVPSTDKVRVVFSFFSFI